MNDMLAVTTGTDAGERLLEFLERDFHIAHVRTDMRHEVISRSGELLDRLLGGEKNECPISIGANLKTVCPHIDDDEAVLKGRWGREVLMRALPLADGGRLYLFRDATSESLAREALREAAEEAAAARRARHVFMSQTAHEFRTPISLILGNADLLLDPFKASGLSEEVALALETIRDAGRILLRNVNDMLELMRVEAGQTIAEPDVYNLAALVQAVVDACGKEADNRDVILDVDQGLLDRAESPRVLVDRILFRKALRHMLLLAVSVCGPGKRVHLEKDRTDEGKLELSLCFDTGIYTPKQVKDAWLDGGHLPELGLAGLTSNHALRLAERIFAVLGCRLRIEETGEREVCLRLVLPEVEK